MSVYVDVVFTYPTEAIAPAARRAGERWSHLWCDPGDEAELHRVAKAIGLKRQWYQTKGRLHHYDVVPTKRALAIAAGAKEYSLRQWLRERRGGV